MEDKARAERELRYPEPCRFWPGYSGGSDNGSQQDDQVEESSSAVSEGPPWEGAVLLIIQIRAFSEALGLF